MRKASVRLGPLSVLVIGVWLLNGALWLPAHPQGAATQKILPKEKVLPGQTPETKAGSVPRFRIGDFIVIVGTGGPPADRAAASPQSRTEVSPPAAKTSAGLSGQGRIVMKGKNVPVTFSGIVLAPGAQGQPPVATSGIVKGTPGPAVEYDLDGFKVKLDRPSLAIGPARASASVALTLARAPFMAAGEGNVLTLASEACEIGADGSVRGQDFHGPSSFALRDSVYRLEIAADPAQTVRLGSAVPNVKVRPERAAGCVLKGEATFDGTTLFSFQGTIDPNGKAAAFDLTLLSTPLAKTPEPGYELTLLSGTVGYRYAANGALVCDGNFNADLKLPPAVKSFDSQPVELRNILLKTDQTGALYNLVSFPKGTQIRAGFDGNTPAEQAIFLIEPYEEGSYVYFPRWQVANSSYPMIAAGATPSKVLPGCQDVLDFLGRAPAGGAKTKARLPKTGAALKAVPLTPGAKMLPAGASVAGPIGLNDDARRRNVFGRPGLTLLQGELYLKSPQVSFPDQPAPPSGEFKLKTRFFGLMTATPWGITGELTSSGASFIPASKPIEECAAPSGASQPTWEEILREQKADPTRRPAPKTGRFRLAELRVLEMKVESLRLCMNALPQAGATMLYVVHFPFPMVVDLDFIDQSLDARGRFHSALGPLAPEADTFSGPSGGKKATVTVPQVRILWAWRLPVTLADRDVAIAFPAGSGPADIQTPPPGSPQKSELWLKPLFSKRSQLKAGVRFGAGMTPKGEFRLTGWDPDPILCGTYAPPGKEWEMGFDCNLSGITLADTGASFNPVTRASDFGWTGKIRFPFFGRQGVAFIVKDLVPSMPDPIAMSNAGGAWFACSETGGGGTILTVENTAANLEVKASRVQYRPRGYPFVSRDVLYRKSPSNEELPAESVEFSSFLCAEVRLPPRENERKDTIDLTEVMVPGPAEPDRAEHLLKDAVYGTSLIDLVCYDKEALTARGLPGDCCGDFWVGTYRVTAGPPGARRIILTAPNVRYYPSAQPVTLGLRSCPVRLTPEGDSADAGSKTLIDVPGVQLKLDNGALRGNFNTTATASFLPAYQGECAFYLDVRKGYFALMIAGSYPITPFPVNVEGESFIFHAPLERLRGAAFGRDDSIINRAEEWALFPPNGSLERTMGTSDLDPRAVVSGVLISGNAAAGVDLCIAERKVARAKVRRGAGLFFLHHDSGSRSGYNCGFFRNDTGKLDAVFIEAELYANWALTPEMPGSFDGVKAFFQNSDLTIRGNIWAFACASILLAHAYVVVDLEAWCSVQEGFGYSGRLDADSGVGDCPSPPRHSGGTSAGGLTAGLRRAP